MFKFEAIFSFFFFYKVFLELAFVLLVKQRILLLTGLLVGVKVTQFIRPVHLDAYEVGRSVFGLENVTLLWRDMQDGVIPCRVRDEG